MVGAFTEHRNVITCASRQVGKSQTSCAFLLWYAMFHKDSTILIVSNKLTSAREMIYRIVKMYENVPDFIRTAINPNDWNKLSISFDNGSRITSAATSASVGRSLSITLLFFDEFAHIPGAGSTEESLDRIVWSSVSPVLAQGGRCIIASTPNGDENMFAELWRGAYIHQNNGFHAIFVPWDIVPGRDDKFRQ